MDTYEKIEKLPCGLSLVQSEDFLKIGDDAVLLAEWAGKGEKICDLGCGVGALLITLAGKRRTAQLVGLELLYGAVELCHRSICINNIQDRAAVFQGDMRYPESWASELKAGYFDLVICNPPYTRAGSGRVPEGNAAYERYDATASPDVVARAASRLLRNGGLIDLVLRPDRLADYIYALRTAKLEPKRICFAARSFEAPPTLMFLEARKGGAAGMTVQPTMILKT